MLSICLRPYADKPQDVHTSVILCLAVPQRPRQLDKTRYGHDWVALATQEQNEEQGLKDNTHLSHADAVGLDWR